MRRLSRRAVLSGVATGGVVIAGCLGGEDGNGEYETEGAESEASDDADEYETDTDEVNLPIADERLPIEHEFEILRGETVSGGPPKDGIPSVDDPTFESADAVGSRLADGDPVFGVIRGGEARAYPQSILVHHEIVNDAIAGDPVAVTYCPLTGTAMGFERGGTAFGVSGNLVNSNLVMYDRATDSRWPQMLATAVDGPFEDASLVEFPVVWSTWGRWREVHPNSQVLTRETGYVRDYDDDPYGSYDPPDGYYAEDRGAMFSPLTADDRLPPKRMVLGARPDDGSLAVDRGSLRDDGIVEIDREGAAYLAVSDPTTGVGHLYRNPDESSYAVEGSRITDAGGETHDPADLPLDRVYTYDAMWFAWAGFYPSTTLHG